jgi:hypothetical protein
VVVLDLVVIGIGVTLEPIPLTSFILLLSARAGVRKGATFIAAWIASLVVIVVAVLVLTGGKPPKPSTTPSTAVLAIKIFLGATLVLFAWRRSRRLGQPPKPATWMSRIDQLSLPAVAGVSVFVQPWVLVAAGAATVAQMKASSVVSIILLIGFCLLCSASFLAMEIHVVRSPDVAGPRLERLRTWLDTHRDHVIIILSLVIGFWLIGDNSYLIAT